MKELLHVISEIIVAEKDLPTDVDSLEKLINSKLKWKLLTLNNVSNGITFMACSMGKYYQLKAVVPSVELANKMCQSSDTLSVICSDSNGMHFLTENKSIKP